MPNNTDPFSIPKPYNGLGIVAFLDLLGFSQAVTSEWHGGTVLKKLFQIRHDIENYKRIAFSIQGYPSGANGYAESALFSDSIIIFANAYDCGSQSLVWPSFLAISGKIQAAIGSAAKAGFGLRGGVELGEVYWDGNDAIGPGFIDAYTIETKVETARVVAGPKLLRALAKELPASSSMHHHSAQFFAQCEDGCFAFSGRFEDLSEIQKTQHHSPDHLRYRYDDILKITDRQNREERRLRPTYYLKAASAIEARLNKPKC